MNKQSYVTIINQEALRTYRSGRDPGRFFVSGIL